MARTAMSGREGWRPDVRKAVVGLLLALAWAGGARADDEPRPPEQDMAVIDRLMTSFVCVEYTLQYDKGEPPVVVHAPAGDGCCGWGSGEMYVREERPLEASGIVLSDDSVLTRDLMIEPRFVKETAVRLGDDSVSADIAGYARREAAVFLKLSRPLEHAQPATFDATAAGPYFCADRYIENAVWTTTMGAWTLEAKMDEQGGRRFEPTGTGLIVNGDGVPAGVAMGAPQPTPDAWRGTPADWPMLTAREMESILARLDAAAAQALLRTRLHFRSPKASERDDWRASEEERATELHVVSLLLDEEHILVLASLPPKATARLTGIAVHCADGTTAEAQFARSLKDYGAFTATLAAPRRGALLWSARHVRDMRHTLLLRCEMRIQGDGHVMHWNRCRPDRHELGWRRQTYPVFRDQRENIFLFEPDGRLAAIPLTRREDVAARDRWYSDDALMISVTDLGFLRGDLAAFSDPNNVPLPEESESRIAWLGLELQALNAELARASGISALTNDGEFGALVSFVYPDSPAAAQGIRQGDVLLRIHAPDRPRPYDVSVEEEWSGYGGFGWDGMDDVPVEYMLDMPPPWPSRDNVFTRTLTEIGLGAECAAEFLREGETRQAPFVVTAAPPHYDAAPRRRSDALDLTVRDLTYEVRRHYQKAPSDPGVIVSRVEPGGKAAVAGIRPYEIITHVGETPLYGVEDFERLAGEGPEVQFSVQRMTRSRQVRIALSEE